MLNDLKTGIDYVSHSTRGLARPENQDGISIVVSNNYSLFFVLDGVGSARNSMLAVNASKQFIRNEHSKFVLQTDYDIGSLILAINNHLLSLQRPQTLTTYCMAYIDHKSGNRRISNLGDSRIYVVNRQYMEQISVDDGLEGTHLITNCLGMKKLTPGELHIQDVPDLDSSLLLCTDGFYHLYEANKMKFFRILNYKSLSRASRELKKEISNNNTDDSTYLILR